MSDDREKIRSLVAREDRTLESIRADKILQLSKRELRTSYFESKTLKKITFQERVIFSRLPTLAVGAAIGMVLLFLLQSSTKFNPNHDVFANEKVLFSTFQKNSEQELSSIVFVDGRIQSADMGTPSSQSGKQELIAVSVGSGKGQIKVIGESGSQVKISFNGRQLTFQILEGSNGEIILVSQNGVWSSDGTRSGDVASLNVTAVRTAL